MSRYPWRNTSEDIAGQVESQWETPLGAQAKADKAEENAKAYSDEKLNAHIGTGGAAHAIAVPNGAAGFISGHDQYKLNHIEPGAQKNKNGFSKINNIIADTPSSTLSIVGDIGIKVSENLSNKSIHLTVTGESAPGNHAITHLVGGSDPIPIASTTNAGLMSPEDKIGIEGLNGQLSKTITELNTHISNSEQEFANLFSQYRLGLKDIKHQYGAEFAIINNEVFQTRDSSRIFCPLILGDAVNRVEFTITEGDFWLFLGGIEYEYTILGIGQSNGKLFNINKTETILLDTNSFTYSPAVGDIITIERRVGKYVLSKKNTNLTFTEFMTINDSDYPTAYYIKNNNNALGFAAHNLNTNPIVKNVMLNYNSSNVQGGSDPIVSINPFVKKKWNALGDSFTAQNVYQGIVQSYLGISMVNSYGISGTMIADPTLSNNNSMSVRYANMDTTADLVTILGGTNDFSYNVPLGSIADTTRETFYGALKVMLEGIITMMPSARVAVFTPTQRDLHMSGEAEGLGPNSIGAYLVEYVDAIKEVCALYAVPVLDLYRVSGITVKNITTYTSDRLHPNALGYSLLARQMASFLNSI